MVFLLRKQKQKRAENKNFTSGQARILFWKREICGPFPGWPSKILAAIEPEGVVLCASLGGAIPGTSVGAQEALRRAGGERRSFLHPCPPAESVGLPVSLFSVNK